MKHQHCAQPAPAAEGPPENDITAIEGQALLVLTTLPDGDTARAIARRLVEQRLAACVNILPPCESVYCWEEALEHDREVPLLIKTTDDRYAALEKMLRSLHPYALPEIIALPLVRGLPGYLDWILRQTR